MLDVTTHPCCAHPSAQLCDLPILLGESYHIHTHTHIHQHIGSNGLRSLLQAGSKPPVPQLYACASAYPAAAKSQRLGRDNLGLFRLHNTRFDVIGGLLYYALVVSVRVLVTRGWGGAFLKGCALVRCVFGVCGAHEAYKGVWKDNRQSHTPAQRTHTHTNTQVIPRCNVMAAVLEAPTLLDSLTLFGRSIGGALSTIFQDSYLSMLVVAGFFLFAHGFACGGGVGCLSHHSAPPRGKGGIGKAGQRLHPSQVRLWVLSGWGLWCVDVLEELTVGLAVPPSVGQSQLCFVPIAC